MLHVQISEKKKGEITDSEEESGKRSAGKKNKHISDEIGISLSGSETEEEEEEIGLTRKSNPRKEARDDERLLVSGEETSSL